MTLPLPTPRHQSTGSPSRHAGLLLPLFSIASARSWGIGEIPDLVPLARWLCSAGQRFVQLLPINEMPPGETSPYSALSAMAIDPQFIALADVEDFAAVGGEASLEQDARAALAEARRSPRVQYGPVRALKAAALRRSFTQFFEREWATGSARATALRDYLDEESWWLADYALFRALHARFDERPWTDWPAALRDREPDAMAAARVELAADVLYRGYVQWLADTQWRSARAAARDIWLFGDLPFMVSGDSADVWARQDLFRMDASVGVPPDAFSETGQDWGLPVYRWDVLAANGFDWLRHRARRNAALFDGYRVDHLVGFYRTYFRPLDGGEPQFTPSDEPAQVALGEAVLAVFQEPGSRIIAEDLGVVPPFVRRSLARLGIPGYKVFRWERDWDLSGQPFHDPSSYAPLSVATSGTHDTEPLTVWWVAAPLEERTAVLAIPSVRERLTTHEREAALTSLELPASARDAMLAALFASGSNLLILPVQDVFGWSDRINQPATVNDANWTWRLKWAVEELATQPEAQAVGRRLREWSLAGRRT
jgi:4-alpha-glucanotransferase